MSLTVFIVHPQFFFHVSVQNRIELFSTFLDESHESRKINKQKPTEYSNYLNCLFSISLLIYVSIFREKYYLQVFSLDGHYGLIVSLHR